MRYLKMKERACHKDSVSSQTANEGMTGERKMEGDMVWNRSEGHNRKI